MTSITISKNVPLKKLHYESVEELQLELILIQQESFDLSDKQVAFLKHCEQEADRAVANGEEGLSWDRSRIKRKNA